MAPSQGSPLLTSAGVAWKYARFSSFMDCKAPLNASHGWRSILAGREILRKGLSWVVGSGDNIRVWRDPWLSSDSPLTHYGPANEMDESLLVNDLLCPLSNTWDKEKIDRYIPQYEALISCLKTSSTPAQDSLVWLPERSGIYSTKTGYGLGMCFSTDRATEPQFN